MAAAGGQHTLLLRSDGQAIAFGSDRHRQCSSLPALKEGRRYVALAAGYRHSAVLRDDNRCFKFGQLPACWCEVPGLMEGIRYTEAVAGGLHTAMLTDDGEVILSGSDSDGQCAYPWENSEGYVGLLDAPEGARYTKIVAGSYHTIAILDTGNVVAFGNNSNGQCDVPELPDGVRYIDAAAGVMHSVLLRDDGEAVAFGENRDGQVEVPSKSLAEFYVDVACGDYHTVLLRNDGEAFVFGRNNDGQCTVPPLPEGLRYGNVVIIIRVSMGVGFKRDTGDLQLYCEGIDGSEIMELSLDPELDETTVGGLRLDLATKLQVPLWSVRLFEQRGIVCRLLPFFDDGKAILHVFEV